MGVYLDGVVEIGEGRLVPLEQSINIATGA
jgi:hypothetical protein